MGRSATNPMPTAVLVAPGEQAGAGGRAHGGHVEAAVAQAAGGEAVDRAGWRCRCRSSRAGRSRGRRARSPARWAPRPPGGAPARRRAATRWIVCPITGLPSCACCSGHPRSPPARLCATAGPYRPPDDPSERMWFRSSVPPPRQVRRSPPPRERVVLLREVAQHHADVVGRRRPVRARSAPRARRCRPGHGLDADRPVGRRRRRQEHVATAEERQGEQRRERLPTGRSRRRRPRRRRTCRSTRFDCGASGRRGQLVAGRPPERSPGRALVAPDLLVPHEREARVVVARSRGGGRCPCRARR